MASYTSKTELDYIWNQMANYVSTNDFNHHLEEFKDYQSKQIEADDFRIIQNNIETLKTNASQYINKSEFYQRL